jgi:BlaI family penicillinase repressor
LALLSGGSGTLVSRSSVSGEKKSEKLRRISLDKGRGPEVQYWRRVSLISSHAGEEVVVVRKRTGTPTALELEILQVVWELGEGTVEGIRTALGDRGRPLAPPSIRTMLAILQEKGYVTRGKVSRAHVYRALLSEEKTKKRILADIVERAFAGSAADLVAALVRAEMVSDEELRQIRQLIEEHDRGA